NKKPLVEQNKAFVELLKTSVIPRVIGVELSAFPLPILAAAIGTGAPTTYQSMTANNTFNWIKALTVKYWEPWAVSVFLGNNLKYKPAKPLSSNRDPLILDPLTADEVAKGEGRIQSGLLVSFSPHYLFNNVFVQKSWLETELRFRDRIRTRTKTSEWDFRLGARFSLAPEIEHIVYASAVKDRGDYFSPKFMLFENTRFEFRFDKGLGANNFWRFALTIGKSFPFKDSHFALSFPIGIIFNINSPYAAGSAWGNQDLVNIVFMPGFRF
ncbi:MAG: hypothetical protein JNM63_12535, partial [Spirochaetia bacterium]|nr:hypothetical protein [Spirochaetia bacterium]